MLKIIQILVVGMLTSLFFFPFEFSFLPGVNTKMMLAGIGLLMFGINQLKRRNTGNGGQKDFAVLSLWAALVSLVGFAAITYNNTYDYTYVSYIVSMWVWLGGAYAAVQLMRMVHGEVTVELVMKYLIGVCVGQCAIALTMELVPVVKGFVDSFLGSTGFMGKVEERMYGIGASLDVAGSRFSAALLMVAYLTLQVDKKGKKMLLVSYLVAFFCIGLIGNMISRTTVVGIGLSMLYWAWMWMRSEEVRRGRLFRYLGGVLCVLVPVAVILYQVNPIFQKNIYFAFEGFFSLIETGRWEVHSNEILKNMYVFPDNWKTWIIGDGYFDNPYGIDPYYTGENWPGFYKATDVGYLRFIYYFGVIGLAAFLGFFCAVTTVCRKRFPRYAMFFGFLLLLNFVVWFKVSTDIFVVFAPFLCLAPEFLEDRVEEIGTLDK